MNLQIDYKQCCKLSYESYANMEPPQHIFDMHKYYNEHGYYRPEDLLRVFGKPNTRVEIPPIPITSSQLIKILINY